MARAEHFATRSERESHVVVHSLWRSCGTYFWSKLRQDIRNRAYYEPLHEEIITQDADAWQRKFRGGITGVLRHPQLDRHYAAELPLRPEGGVRHFREDLCYDRFFLNAEDEHTELETYLRWLVEYATIFGQRACFKFVRGGGRVSFIRRVLRGRHVFINRPPSDVVRSHASFGSDNYFSGVLLYVLVRNRENPFCTALREALKALGPYDDRGILSLSEGGLNAARAIAKDLNVRQLALLVTAFWLAYLLECSSASDIVVDTENLVADEEYRRAVTPELMSLFGPSVVTDFRESQTDIHVEFIAKLSPELRALLAGCPRLVYLGRRLDAAVFRGLGAKSRSVIDRVI